MELMSGRWREWDGWGVTEEEEERLKEEEKGTIC